MKNKTLQEMKSQKTISSQKDLPIKILKSSWKAKSKTKTQKMIIFLEKIYNLEWEIGSRIAGRIKRMMNKIKYYIFN